MPKKKYRVNLSSEERMTLEQLLRYGQSETRKLTHALILLQVDAGLSDEKIAEVVNYVRSHFGNKYKDKVTASQIAKLPHPGSG